MAQANTQISTSKPTKPIIGAFDVTKALFILGLPFVHVIEACADVGQIADSFHVVTSPIVVLSIFGPTIFMICMGIGMAKSNSPKRLRKMGIQMLIISLALNLIRFGIPDLIGVFIGEYTPDVLVTSMLGSDIYMFVGLFFIAYSYLKELKLSSHSIFVIALIALIINILISTCTTFEVPIIEDFIGNFASCGNYAYFPLLGWFIYPCIGILIEEKLFSKNEKEQKRGMGAVFALGSLLLAAACIIINLNDSTLYDALYAQTVYNAYNIEHALLLIGIALMSISLIYFIYKLLPKNPVEKFLLKFSPLLFPFYLLQWTFVGLVCYYPFSFIFFISGTLATLTPALYVVFCAICLAGPLYISLKWGFSISRWLFKVTDYSKWFKQKKRA